MRRHLTLHQVDTAHERGWSALSNGDLLTEAERDGYELLVTTDRNLRYQQSLATRQIAIVVLLSTSWPRIQRTLSAIQAVIDAAVPGAYHEIPILR